MPPSCVKFSFSSGDMSFVCNKLTALAFDRILLFLSYYDCPCLRSDSNNCLCFLSHVLSGMTVHCDHLSFSFCVRNLVFPRFPLLLIHRPAFSRSWRATHVCGSAFCTSSSVGDGAFCTSSSALLLRRRGRRARRRPSDRLSF